MRSIPRVRRERGAAVVDFVLVLVVLVPVFLGHPPGRARAAGAQHLGRGGLRGGAVRRHARPRARPTAPRAPAPRSRGRWPPGSPRTSTRAPVLVARRAGRRGDRPRRRTRSRHRRPGHRAHRHRARRRGGAMKRPPVREGSGERAGRAHLAGHPAAGADGLDRAVGLRGAARRVRGERRGAIGRPGLRARARRRRRVGSRPRRRRGRRWPTRASPTRGGSSTSRAADPADCHTGGAVVTVRITSSVALPFIPDLLGGGRRRFALNAGTTYRSGSTRSRGPCRDPPIRVAGRRP